jgi:hypothetical protein
LLQEDFQAVRARHDQVFLHLNHREVVAEAQAARVVVVTREELNPRHNQVATEVLVLFG